MRGNKSWQLLAAEEALRYGAFVQSFFDNVESSRNLICMHNVQKDLEVPESIVRRSMRINGFYEWWTENTEDYDGDFVQWDQAQRYYAIKAEENDET